MPEGGQMLGPALTLIAAAVLMLSVSARYHQLEAQEALIQKQFWLSQLQDESNIQCSGQEIHTAVTKPQ